MEHTWIVVADQSTAQIFRMKGPRTKAQLQTVETLAPRSPFEQYRSESDAPGNLSFVDLKGPKAEASRRFARRIVDQLKKFQHGGQLRELYVAAPATLVGTLRSLYDNPLAATIRAEIIGDYTKQKPRDLSTRVLSWLR